MNMDLMPETECDAPDTAGLLKTALETFDVSSVQELVPKLDDINSKCITYVPFDDPDATNVDTPLGFFLAEAFEPVRAVLRKGALNQETGEKDSAADLKSINAIVRTLVEAGADVNKQSHFRDSPLQLAVPDVDMMIYLISKGACVRNKSKKYIDHVLVLYPKENVQHSHAVRILEALGETHLTVSYPYRYDLKMTEEKWREKSQPWYIVIK
jgi:hypothetical protein